MKLGTVNKLKKKNTTALKIFDSDAVSSNYDVK